MTEPTVTFDEPQGTLPEIPPAEPKPTKAAAKAAAKASPSTAPKRYKIVLEDSGEIPPTGLPLGINGRTYVLRPSEEATVPEEVVHCLNDAVTDLAHTDPNGNIVGYRSRLRYPYRMLGEVK